METIWRDCVIRVQVARLHHLIMKRFQTIGHCPAMAAFTATRSGMGMLALSVRPLRQIARRKPLRKKADDPASWKRDEETGRQQVFRIRPRSCKEGRRRAPELLMSSASPRLLRFGTCGVQSEARFSAMPLSWAPNSARFSVSWRFREARWRSNGFSPGAPVGKGSRIRTHGGIPVPYAFPVPTRVVAGKHRQDAHDRGPMRLLDPFRFAGNAGNWLRR